MPLPGASIIRYRLEEHLNQNIHFHTLCTQYVSCRIVIIEAERSADEITAVGSTNSDPLQTRILALLHPWFSCDHSSQKDRNERNEFKYHSKISGAFQELISTAKISLLSKPSRFAPFERTFPVAASETSSAPRLVQQLDARGLEVCGVSRLPEPNHLSRLKASYQSPSDAKPVSP